MEETEVKILEIDQRKTVQVLAKIGAKKIFEGDVSTLFLDSPDGQIHKRRDVLRIRKEEDKVKLTYKEVKANRKAKVAQEQTVEISDLETMLWILGKIGLSVTQKMDKHRISYKTEDARFDIDRYEGEYGFIPAFMEIEGSEDSIKKYSRLLGVNEKECLSWSTDELIEHYQTKKT